MGHRSRERAWTEIERRIVAGELASGLRIDEEALADELAVRVGAVREALSALERDGFVRGEVDGGYSVAELSEVEVREAYPMAILLEGLALRETHAFPPDAIARLRSINEEMAGSLGDPMKAATCDWAFHDELTGHCGNDQLLGTLRPLKRMLLRYEHTYMSAEEFVNRSVGQHWLIIEALERGDTEAAAATASANFRDSLPGILERLQGFPVEAPE
jgi:DNA-binding GntR family transcriptional regulator